MKKSRAETQVVQLATTPPNLRQRLVSSLVHERDAIPTVVSDFKLPFCRADVSVSYQLTMFN